MTGAIRESKAGCGIDPGSQGSRSLHSFATQGRQLRQGFHRSYGLRHQGNGSPGGALILPRYVGTSHGQVPVVDRDLYEVICAAQDRFKVPHLRWQWCHRMPFPFRYGPNAAFFLLLAMLAAYALIVALVNWRSA
jgi:hypothetical protein